MVSFYFTTEDRHGAFVRKIFYTSDNSNLGWLPLYAYSRHLDLIMPRFYMISFVSVNEQREVQESFKEWDKKPSDTDNLILTSIYNLHRKWGTDGTHQTSKQSPFAFKHLLHHGNKTCITVLIKSESKSVTKTWPPASKVLLKRAQGDKSLGPILSTEFVTDNGATVAKL